MAKEERAVGSVQSGPSSALELARLLENGTVDFRPHPGQWGAWMSLRRIILVLAGTQGGKTSFGPHWLLREMKLRGPGDYMVVTPTFPLLEKKALPEFRKLFERWFRLGTYVQSPVRVFRVSAEGASRMHPCPEGFSDREWQRHLAENPTTVQFGYAEDPESLESATAKAAWLDEAGQRKFRLAAWEAIRRRLSIHTGRVLLTTTPYDLGWLKQTIYDRWEKGDPEIDVLRFDSTENPVFPQAEFDAVRATMPKWKFDLFYRGIFTRPAGQIYDCFRDWTGVRETETGHLVKRFPVPPDWPRLVGIDFGGVNTAALIVATNPRTGKRSMIAEYHAGWRSAAQHARAIKALAGGRIAGCWGGAKSEGQWRLEFKKGGLDVLEPLVSDVEVGIDTVYACHQLNEYEVFEDLQHYRAQKTSYSRVLDEVGEPTEVIEDKNKYHLLDAERYLAPVFRSGRSAAPVTGGERQAVAAARSEKGPLTKPGRHSRLLT